MKIWIELGLVVLVLLIFRDRIIFALLILIMPKSWQKEAFRKASERVSK